jgi:hypothetical protein
MMLIRTCEHPGCRTPARFSQVDHSEEWSRGGSTHQSNGGIGCGPHNRRKHEHGWRTRRSKRGRSYTVREDGTIMLPVGASPPDLESSLDVPDENRDHLAEIPGAFTPREPARPIARPEPPPHSPEDDEFWAGYLAAITTGLDLAVVSA